MAHGAWPAGAWPAAGQPAARHEGAGRQPGRGDPRPVRDDPRPGFRRCRLGQRGTGPAHRGLADVRRRGRRPDGRGPHPAPLPAARDLLHHHRRGRDTGLRDPLRPAPAGRGGERDRRPHGVTPPADRAEHGRGPAASLRKPLDPGHLGIPGSVLRLPGRGGQPADRGHRPRLRLHKRPGRGGAARTRVSRLRPHREHPAAPSDGAADGRGSGQFLDAARSRAHGHRCRAAGRLAAAGVPSRVQR